MSHFWILRAGSSDRLKILHGVAVGGRAMGGGSGAGGGGGGGINGLPQMLRNGKPNATLADFVGKRLGVDLSAFIHLAMHTDQCANQYHWQPHIPVTAVLRKVKPLLELARSHNITLLWVADGVSPPCKEDVEGAQRKKDYDAAVTKLKGILRDRRPADLDEAIKERKKSMVVRQDMMYLVVKYLRDERQTVRQRARVPGPLRRS